MQLPTTLGPGDRAPNFLLPGLDEKLWVFYERVKGRRNLLILIPAAGPATETVLARLEDAREEFGSAFVDLFLVLGMPPAGGVRLAPAIGDGGFVFCDPKGEVTRGYAGAFGCDPQSPLCLLLDENQRVLDVLPQRGTPEALSAGLLAACREHPPASGAPKILCQIAPVLIVPNVLDAAICRALIDRWRESGNEEGMVQSRAPHGGDVTMLDRATKSRRDHQVTDRKLAEHLAGFVGRRIGPEMAKAFYVQGLAFDRFVITCYSGERGDHFRMHRDNTTAGSQHRKFALTLNLNSDEHDGGELWFPEYGSTRYKPGAGGAIIFSCSLLHEALPVRAGNRFTLLNFLSDPPQARATPMANPFGQWGAAQGRPAA